MSDPSFPGVRNGPAVPVGGFSRLAVDGTGALIVTGGFVPPAGSALAFCRFATVSAVIKAAAGFLFSIAATNRNIGLRYLQVFNKAAVPVGGDVPIMQWLVLSGAQSVIGNDALIGLAGAVGLAYGMSTTSGVYTAATAADHDVQGLYV